MLQPGPKGYSVPARYPTFFPIPDPTMFSFENHRVLGDPKYYRYYPVLPDILGKPEHRVYPKYPDIPRSKSGTRKYLIDYFNTSPQPKPDRYPTFFQYPTRTCPILKNTTHWALWLQQVYSAWTSDHQKCISS